jgi:hypothetical protein
LRRPRKQDVIWIDRGGSRSPRGGDQEVRLTAPSLLSHQ